MLAPNGPTAGLSMSVDRDNPGVACRRHQDRFWSGADAACRILPQAPLHRIIVLAAAPMLTASLGVPGLEKGP